MSKVFFNAKGQVIMKGGKVILCDHCPCGGFPGWINPENKYMYYEYRDWDCCLFGSNPVSEGGFSKVDGHVTFQYISENDCVVVESTGNYAPQYPVGTHYGLSGGYPSPFVMGSDIVSDTLRYSDIRNSGCCNGDGSRIYAVMFNDDEEFE